MSKRVALSPWVKKHWKGLVIVVAVAVAVLGVFGWRFVTLRNELSRAKADKDAAVNAARAEALAQGHAEGLAEAEENAVFSAEVATQLVKVEVLQTDIQSIGELATMEYLYSDANAYADTKQLFGHNVPLTTKSFVLKWDGVIKAGIRDLNRITVTVDDPAAALDGEGESGGEEAPEDMTVHITVRMPRAELLSHEIDHDSIVTVDESNTVFNAISSKDVNTLINESMVLMEERVKESDLLNKAEENARELIRQMITNIVTAMDRTCEIEFIMLTYASA